MSEASYLLKAPQSDMDRWKAQAELHGVSFAALIREALDSYAPGAEVVRRPHQPTARDLAVKQVQPRFKGGKH